MATPVTPSEFNGAMNGSRTPSLSGLSLTEYTANPTPPQEGEKHGKERVNDVVPADFILPTGYPDVRGRRVLDYMPQ